MKRKYFKTMVATGVLLAVCLSGLAGFAADPRPNPGMPATPSRGLPNVSVPALPEKPDLYLTISGSGLGGLADLYPDNPGMGPSRFYVSGQVLNGGRASVAGCQVDLLLSSDRKASSDDRLLERVAVAGSIPPFDGFRYGSAPLPRKEYGIAGIPPGTYFICGKVDPANAIVEKDENNNGSCSPEAIRIHPAGAK